MIWTADRNKEQGTLVAAIYQQANAVLCEHQAVFVGGLPGADTAEALAQAGIDPGRYLAIGVDRILLAMAERGLIPQIPQLSPLDAADLAHTEAQFLAKRLGMRALGEGKNLLWEVSLASPHSIESWLTAHQHAGYTTTGILAEISIEEPVRRAEASHRRGHELYRRGHGYGDRYLPPEAIRALADAPTAAPATRTNTDGPSTARTRGAGQSSADEEVTALIGSYLAGELTLGMLSQHFRTRRWAPKPPACPQGMEQAAPAIDNREPYITLSPTRRSRIIATSVLGRIALGEDPASDTMLQYVYHSPEIRRPRLGDPIARNVHAKKSAT